jgi:hypothetical protein
MIVRNRDVSRFQVPLNAVRACLVDRGAESEAAKLTFGDVCGSRSTRQPDEEA